MGNGQDEAISVVLQYLEAEWNTNVNIDKSKAILPFDSSRMVLVTPECPGQPDLSSCGLYLLQYIGKVFEDVDKFSMLQSYKNIKSWTNDEEMKKKRSDIASQLKRISKEQGRYGHLVFPELDFFQTRNSTLTEENADIAYFNAYLKNAAESELNFSLCRQYSLQLFVSAERHLRLVYLLRQFQQKMQAECIRIALFEDHIKDEQYTKAEIMACLKQMEKDGLIIMDKNDIYLIKK